MSKKNAPNAPVDNQPNDLESLLASDEAPGLGEVVEPPQPVVASRPASREQAYNAIDSERDYQNQRWHRRDEDDAAGHNPHTPTEWLLYIQHYVTEAIYVATTTNDPEARDLTLNFLRKIAALGVVAMEQHGAPQRAGYER